MGVNFYRYSFKERWYVLLQLFSCSSLNAKVKEVLQESHAIARKPRDAAAVRCGLKFADIQYKFKNIPSSESQSYRHTGAKQINVKSHSRSFKVTDT